MYHYPKINISVNPVVAFWLYNHHTTVVQPNFIAGNMPTPNPYHHELTPTRLTNSYLLSYCYRITHPQHHF